VTRQVVYYLTITPDGMYAGPDGSLEFFEPSEEEHRFANALVRDAGDIVISRGMYDVMAYWDELDLDDPAASEFEAEFGRHWRDTPKHVVSRGRPALRAGASLVEGDPLEFVRRLREGDGPPIMVDTGAELFATMAEADLIDVYQFLVAPTLLGQGKALFGRLRQPLRLQPTGTKTFANGDVLLQYAPRR
jgi:dihydrofolate reductase